MNSLHYLSKENNSPAAAETRRLCDEAASPRLTFRGLGTARVSQSQSLFRSPHTRHPDPAAAAAARESRSANWSVRPESGVWPPPYVPRSSAFSCSSSSRETCVIIDDAIQTHLLVSDGHRSLRGICLRDILRRRCCASSTRGPADPAKHLSLNRRTRRTHTHMHGLSLANCDRQH